MSHRFCLNSKSLPLSFWFHLTSFRVFQGLNRFGWPISIYELDGAESGGETGVGDPALQILDEALRRPPLVGPLAREGLWYAAGSGGRRQEMFVIRAFPSGKLPSSPH